MKILITGGKSAQAFKLLKAFNGHQVILADYGDMPSLSSPGYRFLTLGDRNDETTAHSLLNTCLNESVDLLLPLHEFEVFAVSKSIVLFEEFNIEVLLPDLIELPKYFYNQDDINIRQNWAVYRKGVLLYALNSSPELLKLGAEKNLHGVFYIPDVTAGLTAILFTIP